MSAIGMKVLRKCNAAYKWPRQRHAAQQFAALAVEQGDLAIDCGANVGEVTEQLHGRGAEVWAFEPNPVAFEQLQERFSAIDSVHCRQTALVAEGSWARLFLHRRHASDPIGHSAGSSLVTGKHNLDENAWIDVQATVLSDFIASLERRVRVLKIDVEGYEVELLSSLLDSGMIHRVDYIFCETHEFKVPGLYRALRGLRQRLAEEGVSHVNLDWH
jgi:FkbM family methyltransferase